jgi:hygromycin-B 4-O-kinase
MGKRTQAQIQSKKLLVKKLIKHHFGQTATSIEFKPAGLTNYVFELSLKKEKYIVRIAGSASKLQDYMKEQWAVSKAKEKGIPVAEILEVGSEIISTPYMLQRKLEGTDAMHHPDRHQVLHDLGRYAQLIHSIPTSNFGDVFDWSQNKLSKNKTWKEFLNNELAFAGRLQVIEKLNILTKPHLKKFISQFHAIEKWKDTPCLNHGDLRLKNVIASDNGKILAIIDWENCMSNIAPYWDLSIALHDLSIDEKQCFLDGYGISPEAFEKMSHAIRTINIINYAPILQEISQRKDKHALAWYRLRLNGQMDLY